MCAVHKKKQGLNVPDWVREQWNKDQSGTAKMLMDANWDKDHAVHTCYLDCVLLQLQLLSFLCLASRYGQYLYSTIRTAVLFYTYIFWHEQLFQSPSFISQDEFIRQLEVVVKQKNTVTVVVEEQWMSEKELREELKWSPFLSMFKIYIWVSNEHISMFFNSAQMNPHTRTAYERIVPEASHPGSKESFGSQSWHSCQETRVAAMHDSWNPNKYLQNSKIQNNHSLPSIAGLCKSFVNLPIEQWREVCAKQSPRFYISTPWVHAAGRKNQYDGVVEYLVVLREKGSRQEEKSQEEIHRQIGKAWLTIANFILVLFG